MAINPLGINNGTQAYINFDLTGTVNTQVVNIGTISGNIPGGSVAVTSIPNTPGGTLGLVTRVGNVGTVEVGTISSMPNIPGGTIGLVTRVGNLGTLEVGTISTLPNIPGGSIAVTSGTIAAGSIRVVAGTVGGAAGTAAALSGNPVPVGGVTAGGTVYGLLVDSAGVLQVNGTVSTGGAGTQPTRIIDGTVTRVSTIGTLEVGTISTMPNIPGGTIGLITRVGNVGTLEVGTITTLPNVPGGTLGLVTTVSNITNGSVRITVGTITEGTIRNLISGTINAATAILNSGTINVGTFVMPSGTISVLPNLPQGSINVTAGTFRDDGRTTRNILSYGTQFGGTAAGYATLVGSTAVGVGTSTWVCDVSINNPSGNIVCLVGFGTALQGTSVLLRGTYGTSAGVGQQRSFPKAVNSGMTNQDLVAYIGGAGTVDFNVSYFISA